MSSLIFLAILIGIFYFMLIRPQKKRMQAHRELVESIGPGDEIVTIGGLFGTVSAVRDEEVEIEVSPGTRLRFVKSAISRKVSEDSAESEAPAETTASE